MDRMLYVAMSGAKQILQAQAVNTHNLANASTTGFRADLSQFRAMPVFGDGLPTRVYAMTERPGTDFDYGTLMTTGRDLDVAVKGEGWIAVQAPDGSEGYTRAGDLRINTLGVLETGAGRPVLGNAGPIAIPPADKIEIGSDGTVSIQPRGQQANTLAVIDRIRLVNAPEGQLVKGNDGLMHMATPGAVAPPDARVQLATGALESSNVNGVEAMVDMIDLSRRFEMQVKMMDLARENDQASAQIMHIA